MSVRENRRAAVFKFLGKLRTVLVYVFAVCFLSAMISLALLKALDMSLFKEIGIISTIIGCVSGFTMLFVGLLKDEFSPSVKIDT